MSASLIEGKIVAQAVRKQVQEDAARLHAQGVRPGLATVLVGGDPASHTYVQFKHKACHELGLDSFDRRLPEDATQAQLEGVIRELGEDERVHGILVQLPLPGHLKEEQALSLIPLEKDVDGFHPVNTGLLAQKGRDPYFVPCTPAGCMELLAHTGVPVAGAEAVVVGRSNIVGMPAALLLNRRDATVTIVHSRTRDMAAVIRRADIVVVGIGKPRFITGDMLKPGCTVIDVGINRVDGKLVGDVDFASAREVAGHITPVPGGVGPMTIAMLLQNTVRAAQRRLERTPSGV